MALELSFGKGKDKKPKASAGPKNDITLKFVEFFEKNPLMKIIVPVVIFVIIVAILVFVIFGDGVIMDNVDDMAVNGPVNQADAVDIISGDSSEIKDKTLIKLIEDDPLSPDILSSAKYTGYIVGSSGLKTAQVEIGAEGDTLVLSIGETVADSEWVVKELTPSYILFKAGELTKKINIA